MIVVGLILGVLIAIAKGGSGSGHYEGGSGSSHKGGHYVNSATDDHYTRHK